VLSVDSEKVVLKRLFDLIKKNALIFGKFTLASGEESTYYFDIKKAVFDPETIDLIATAILDRLKDEDFDFLGGMEVGAIPLIAAVVLKSFKEGRPISGFFVRKKLKDHGTRKRVEGWVEKGSKVILLEDVTTSGTSIMEAIGTVEEMGCTVKKVITIIDREKGAEERLKSLGIEFYALFKKSDFGV
jgi:orotate phosphoribosyltransferase